MPIVAGPYRNPGRWRAVIYQQEIRHSTAGCLLSPILLSPLFVRVYGAGLVAGVSLLYAAVLVPAITGYYSLPGLLVRWVRRLRKYAESHPMQPISRYAAYRASYWSRDIILSLLLVEKETTLCIGHATAPIPGYWVLATLVLLPYAVTAARGSLTLFPCVGLYVLIVLPLALAPQLGLQPPWWTTAILRLATTQQDCYVVLLCFVAAITLWLAFTLSSPWLVLGSAYHWLGSLRSFIWSFICGVSDSLYQNSSWPASVLSSLWSAIYPSLWSILSVLSTPAVLSLVIVALWMNTSALATVKDCLLHARALRVIASQVVFCALLERVMRGETHAAGLYCVLTYNTLLYLATRTQKCLTVFVRPVSVVTGTIWATSAKLGKAAILTVLLGATGTRIFEHTDWQYTVLALLYCAAADYTWTGEERLVTWASAVAGEDAELWIPAIGTFAPAGAAVAALVSLREILWTNAGPLCSLQLPVLSLRISCPSSTWCLALAGLYSCVAVPLLVLREDWHLRAGAGWLFARATAEECSRQGRCAVCQEWLKSGRVTACRHVYHRRCLHDLLQHCMQCAICKREM